MATQMHFLIGDYITVCSRIKHESSSSDEEHSAAKPSSAGHLALLSSVGYKKTLRLTSEQLVSVLFFPRRVCGHWPRHGRPDSEDGMVWVSLSPSGSHFYSWHLFYPRVPTALWLPQDPLLVPRVFTLTPAPVQAGSSVLLPLGFPDAALAAPVFKC